MKSTQTYVHWVGDAIQPSYPVDPSPPAHTTKDKNVMDLTETEDIKRKWQRYIEPYKKDLHDPDNQIIMMVWSLI